MPGPAAFSSAGSKSLSGRAIVDIPHSLPLREFRLDAGLTLHQLAMDLDVHWDSVWSWEAGSQRPDAGHLRALVQRFNNRIDLAVAVRLFWHENIGDPCPCGCGGEKIFPNNDRAKHLYIKLPCQICGTRSTKEVVAFYKYTRRRCATGSGVANCDRYESIAKWASIGRAVAAAGDTGTKGRQNS